MGILKSIFGKPNNHKSDESDILSAILRLEIIDSSTSTEQISLVEKSALLLNTNESTFFENIDSSLKNIPVEQQPITSTVKSVKSDDYNSCWIVFENPTIQKMITDINSVSSYIASLGLGNNMTAAIFKTLFKNKSSYGVCNYRTARFYPLVPTDDGKRDNNMEMEIGDILSSKGIPLEPYSNWYSLSDIPF